MSVTLAGAQAAGLEQSRQRFPRGALRPAQFRLDHFRPFSTVTVPHLADRRIFFPDAVIRNEAVLSLSHRAVLASLAGEFILSWPPLSPARYARDA